MADEQDVIDAMDALKAEIITLDASIAELRSDFTTINQIFTNLTTTTNSLADSVDALNTTIS